MYQRVLSVTSPQAKLYLALPLAAYAKLQQRSSFRLLMRLGDLDLIVVAMETEEITSWIEAASTGPSS